jgi:hypothetical protein
MTRNCVIHSDHVIFFITAKYRGIRWVGDVAWMGRKIKAYESSMGKPS